MIGVAALTMTLSVMGGFEQSIKERVLNLSPQVQILNSRIDRELRDIEKKVDHAPGVAGAEAYIIGQAMLSSARGIGGVVVRGVEPRQSRGRIAAQRYMTAGILPMLRAVRSGARCGARIGNGSRSESTLAKKLKVKPGDPVRCRADYLRRRRIADQERAFVIGAIFDSGMNFVDTNMVFMDLATRAGFLRPPGQGGRSRYPSHQPRSDRRGHRRDAQLFSSPYRVRNWIEFNQSAAAGFAMLKRVYCAGAGDADRCRRVQPGRDADHGRDGEAQGHRGADGDGCDAADVRLIFVLKGLIVGAAGPQRGWCLAQSDASRSRATSSFTSRAKSTASRRCRSTSSRQLRRRSRWPR